MIRADLVIIGAGPTGLGALQRFCELKSQNYIGVSKLYYIIKKVMLVQRHTKVLIIDREEVAGGLSRTITDKNGFKWDIGVHVIGSSRFPSFLKMLAETIPDWNVIKRCVKVTFNSVIC
jgi:protoporphyrinogen oxidase